MSEEILINGKKITELSDMFFEYCKLKKENEELKTYIQKMDKPEIKTIDSEIALKNIELQQENEKIKKTCLIMPKVNQLAVPIEKYEKLYKALEEIRKKITPVCTCCNNIDGFTILDDCENVCEKGVIKYLKIIDEVLDEQK